jgi:site-specific DNA-cytosine methylase
LEIKLIPFIIQQKPAQSAKAKKYSMPKVLDLFCGLGGWSRAFHEAGYQCTGIDIKNLDYPGHFIKADINEWIPDQSYDIILASPPCNEFSLSKKWGHGTQDERQGLDLVYRTFYLIQLIKPRFFIVENVKGLAEFLPPPTDIIKYNRHKNGKAAYLWSNIGKLGFLDKMIDKKIDINNDTKSSRALIPYPLSKAVLDKIKKTS